jgi:hypothetical protein
MVYPNSIGRPLRMHPWSIKLEAYQKCLCHTGPGDVKTSPRLPLPILTRERPGTRETRARKNMNPELWAQSLGSLYPALQFMEHSL